MEIYSLEEDDYSGMFLTQTPRVEKVENPILPDPSDFKSPCVSLIGGIKAAYSDISEDEDFEMPSSQPVRNMEKQEQRCV